MQIMAIFLIRWQSDDLIHVVTGSAPLVLCCDQFDHGSRQEKREPVDLVQRFMTYHFVSKYGHNMKSKHKAAQLLQFQIIAFC